MNHEMKRHISVLERSNEEQQRSIRKREKELEQIKNEYEHHMEDASSLNQRVFIKHLFLFSYVFVSLFYSVQNRKLN